MKTKLQKRRFKKLGKGALLIVILMLIIFGLVKVISNVREANKAREVALVDAYVSCLEDNFTQRDYCAKEVGSEYHYMDLLIKNYGYDYIQKGYDLYVVRVK